MNETADQTTSRLAPDSATNLTDLFIMFALERRRGTATASEIGEMLAQFGIVISVDTINTRANPKRASKPFRKDGDQISFVNEDATMQYHFLARARSLFIAFERALACRTLFTFFVSRSVRLLGIFSLHIQRLAASNTPAIHTVKLRFIIGACAAQSVVK